MSSNALATSTERHSPAIIAGPRDFSSGALDRIPVSDISMGSLSEVAGLSNSRVRCPLPKSALTNRRDVFMAWRGKTRTSAPRKGCVPEPQLQEKIP